MADKMFPLSWPVGWNRASVQQTSRFKPMSAYAETLELIHQLNLMGAEDIVVSSNMQYRADGIPYARQSVHDTGIAVYFKFEGAEQCIPCDKWTQLESNIRAITKTIEALRGIERWGAKEMVNAAFRGFQALPVAIVTQPPKRAWWVVLDVSESATESQVITAYRSAAKRFHPDVGGSPESFEEVTRAFNEWKQTHGK